MIYQAPECAKADQCDEVKGSYEDRPTRRWFAGTVRTRGRRNRSSSAGLNTAKHDQPARVMVEDRSVKRIEGVSSRVVRMGGR